LLNPTITKKELEEQRKYLIKSFHEFFERTEKKQAFQSLDKDWEEFLEYYKLSLQGDLDATHFIWVALEDPERVKLTLHFWELVAEKKVSQEVWGTILQKSWQRGKSGCLLLKAKLPPKIILEMFEYADLKTLMSDSGEYDRFSKLPEQTEIWRGTSKRSTHRENGLSWTTNILQAEWFAYRNCSRNDQPILIHAITDRKNILAIFNYENEVVINPITAKKLNIQSFKSLPSEDWHDRMNELREVLKTDAA
jgi:hypothetical protein